MLTLIEIGDRIISAIGAWFLISLLVAGIYAWFKRRGSSEK